MSTAYDVEDAMITALKAACTGAWVERFEGNIPALDTWLAQVRIPALAVFYYGRKLDQPSESAGIERIEANFQIWFVSDRLRGYGKAMTEDSGIYAQMAAAETALRGQRLGLSINPLRLTAEDPVLMDSESGKIIWMQQWTTNWIS